jgi:hypothetical protein
MTRWNNTAPKKKAERFNRSFKRMPSLFIEKPPGCWPTREAYPDRALISTTISASAPTRAITPRAAIVRQNGNRPRGKLPAWRRDHIVTQSEEFLARLS